MTLIYLCISGLMFVTAYWSLSSRHQGKVILFGNVAFLLYFGLLFFCLQFASSLLHFYSARQISRKQNQARNAARMWLGICVFVDISLCIFAKSHVFNGENHLLPIGISFNALVNLGYVLSVDRGVVNAVSFVDFYSFSSFFPCLLMGPVEKIQNLLTQLQTQKKFRVADLGEGIFLISLGIFKKFVVADRLADLNVNQNKYFKTYTAYELWLFFILCLFEIYCDFSAYIDIVRGFSKILGIRLSQNFDQPYLAKSIPDIWSRWNITVVNWMREYLYYPTLLKTKNIYLATAVVMVAMGMWHDPTLLLFLWGGYWSLLYSIHIQLRVRGITLVKNHFASSILMILAMAFSTVFFISVNLPDLAEVFTRAFSLRSEFSRGSFYDQFGPKGLLYLVLAACLIFFAESLQKKSKSVVLFFALAFCFGILTILMGVSDSKVFLYMRY